MKSILTSPKVLTLLVFSFYFLPAKSQKILESRHSSYYTYIFSITDMEALKVYRRSVWEVDESFFHSLVDSFPTDEKYSGKLAPGHYLKVHAEENRQKVAITSISDFEVFILDNGVDLIVQVYDLQGNIIPDAAVSVRGKNLHYRKSTRSYTDSKSNQKGILKVSYNGQRAYFDLNRHYNNSCFKRGLRKLVYGTPVKYVWIPVNFIVRIPVDGVRSVIRLWPVGTISRITTFFRQSFERIACRFNEYYCENYILNKFTNRYSGYMVFNQPKYRPGDTVRFKAYIIDKKGKPLNKPVDVMLEGYRTEIKLNHLSPYCKGGYSYEFLLHDSLDLKLDSRYSVELRKNNRKIYFSKDFSYEDYELGKNKLELRLGQADHYRDQEMMLYVKGTDENDLNLPDARLEVLLTPGSINNIIGANVFIPDTIFYTEIPLDPGDETRIPISDSLFPEVNIDYSIDVRLLTSDNEVIAGSEKLTYYYERENFTMDLKMDSIKFEYEKNGVSENREVSIHALDNYGNETLMFEGKVPCMLELDPFYASYRIKTDSMVQTFLIAQQPSLLKCFSDRTADSINIVVDNPRKLPFNYTLYRRNTKIRSDYTDSLDLTDKTAGKQHYFISIQYLWGGKMQRDEYRIPLVENHLNVSVKQPKLVYPGQTSTIEVQVTDAEGKPVEGVDLTAYSLTSKFKYSPPELPALEKSRSNRTVINSFTLGEFPAGGQYGRRLNYDTWKVMAGLDSIEYYRFLYPGDSIYQTSYKTKRGITQFAPFAVFKGEIEPVYVVYFDNHPVYLGWATNNSPYSFMAFSGYHRVKIRTLNKIITVDSVWVERGMKTIMSVDLESKHPLVRMEKAENKLSDAEKRALYPYFFPYRNNFGENLAYIEQFGKIQLLNPSLKSYPRDMIGGPVSGQWTFHLLDSFSTTFNHDPNYEYEFSKGLLKMTSYDDWKYPKYIYSHPRIPLLNEEVLTKSSVDLLWEEYVNSKRYTKARYLYPTKTSPGAGRLEFHFTNEEVNTDRVPLNMLVFRYDNHEFLRIYPGNARMVHELGEGSYRLIFFYPGSKYHIEDSVFVKANGLNYYQFKQPDEFSKDTFSIYVNDLIGKTVFKSTPLPGVEARELQKVYRQYQQQYQFNGEGTTIQGYVVEAETGESLPGVTVVVKGTTFGTITNIDGYYSIKVPWGNPVLEFSYVGYVTQEKAVGENDIVNMELPSDLLSLEEVVVVGYGVTKKSSVTGAVMSVKTGDLLQGIPGVSGNLVESLQGRAAGVSIIENSGVPGEAVSIQIRGISSYQFASRPLYIINGNVYSGDISILNPDLITAINILQDSTATAMYGTRGAAGVVVIETEDEAFKPALKGANYDAAFFEAVSKASSIREDFSDYAFWEPRLLTDGEGRVRFDVSFPDDVTSWETYYLAMNGKKQTGQAEGLVKSYKPIMAQLAVPRFLIPDDTTYVIGKVLNYTSDSLQTRMKFEVDGQHTDSRRRYCANALVDSLQVVAPQDSVVLTYSVELNDGYFDGERREIPVFRAGLEESRGNFYVLDEDTSVQLSFDAGLGEVSLYARADVFDVLQDEMSRLINYRYGCNEQIASKLKALLSEQTLAKYRGRDFTREEQIRKMIRLLQRNQKESGLWGWWKNSTENEWISLHVLEALLQAGQQGFSVKLDKDELAGKLIWDLENSSDFYVRLRILRMLKLMQMPYDYELYIRDLERMPDRSPDKSLQLIRLKQLCGLEYSLDVLPSFQDTTHFGNLYFSAKEGRDLLINDVQNTVLAYRILEADTLDHQEELKKIRNYFFEIRSEGYWSNTYESIRIIETILPGMLENSGTVAEPVLYLTGDLDTTITGFPFEMKVDPHLQVKVSRTGSFPVYFTNYQHFWNPAPIATRDGFAVSTEFVGIERNELKAGQEATLRATVKVMDDARYVMVNIPIPAGCSYAEKKNGSRYEAHREYFRHETAIFCEYLPKGEYSFELKLMPRYSGSYTLNPAKAELMYFPLIKGNNEIRRVKVR
ncbi:MAG: carboxypeptidase-like regulatory domain-containing protein [Bacteroidales bacterium]|nr:carboxypeptidase-like regulatory domain-containing protein [Bacteroidales bacterium]